MPYTYFPKVNLMGEISATKLNTDGNPMRMQPINGSPSSPDFKSFMVDSVRTLDNTVKAPDQVMSDAILGNGADVHDVMIAISKAELSVNVATQTTTKLIQAYEKISSIQV